MLSGPGPPPSSQKGYRGPGTPPMSPTRGQQYYAQHRSVLQASRGGVSVSGGVSGSNRWKSNALDNLHFEDEENQIGNAGGFDGGQTDMLLNKAKKIQHHQPPFRFHGLSAELSRDHQYQKSSWFNKFSYIGTKIFFKKLAFYTIIILILICILDGEAVSMKTSSSSDAKSSVNKKSENKTADERGGIPDVSESKPKDMPDAKRWVGELPQRPDLSPMGGWDIPSQSVDNKFDRAFNNVAGPGMLPFESVGGEASSFLKVEGNEGERGSSSKGVGTGNDRKEVKRNVLSRNRKRNALDKVFSTGMWNEGEAETANTGIGSTNQKRHFTPISFLMKKQKQKQTQALSGGGESFSPNAPPSMPPFPTSPALPAFPSAPLAPSMPASPPDRPLAPMPDLPTQNIPNAPAPMMPPAPPYPVMMHAPPMPNYPTFPRAPPLPPTPPEAPTPRDLPSAPSMPDAPSAPVAPPMPELPQVAPWPNFGRLPPPASNPFLMHGFNPGKLKPLDRNQPVKAYDAMMLISPQRPTYAHGSSIPWKEGAKTPYAFGFEDAAGHLQSAAMGMGVQAEPNPSHPITANSWKFDADKKILPKVDPNGAPVETPLQRLNPVTGKPMLDVNGNPEFQQIDQEHCEHKFDQFGNPVWGPLAGAMPCKQQYAAGTVKPVLEGGGGPGSSPPGTKEPQVAMPVDQKLEQPQPPVAKPESPQWWGSTPSEAAQGQGVTPSESAQPPPAPPASNPTPPTQNTVGTQPSTPANGAGVQGTATTAKEAVQQQQGIAPAGGSSSSSSGSNGSGENGNKDDKNKEDSATAAAIAEHTADSRTLTIMVGIVGAVIGVLIIVAIVVCCVLHAQKNSDFASEDDSRGV